MGTDSARMKKIPVPTVAPTPIMVSWKVPIDCLRCPPAPWAVGAPEVGRRRSSCWARLGDEGAMLPPVAGRKLPEAGQRISELVYRPIDFALGDDKGWREPERRTVRVLH
ncbi:Uncharacterised protein [Mycobacteroides abscessus subsp. abscessus]|nr:Uncharacterised protein [Mycobacteroides abscessus subsp. abscessus]SLC91300.1 Uncharacterised protein [Mycobacteroides abscessus subsp. massiliense]